MCAAWSQSSRLWLASAPPILGDPGIGAAAYQVQREAPPLEASKGASIQGRNQIYILYKRARAQAFKLALS